MTKQDSDGETDPEAPVAPRGPDVVVVSGEAELPDEHTRRVAAAKAMRNGESLPEPTVLNVHTDTIARQEVAPKSRQTEVVEARFGAPRGDRAAGRSDPRQVEAYRDQPARGAPQAAVRNAEELGVEAYRDQPARGAGLEPEAPEPRVVLAYRPETAPFAASAAAAKSGPPTAKSPPPADAAPPAQAPPPPADPAASPPEQSSRSMAERSLRERRRERDRRAEKVAIRTVLLVFLGLGGAIYFLINSDLIGGSERGAGKAASGELNQGATAPTASAPVKTIVTSASPDETPDIPALRQLVAEGLTIAAEGLPEVLIESAGAPAALAARETCRFAYGVWEFSPNKRFRFLTTCGALEGQTLFGAYEVRGSIVQMSPLLDPPAQMVSRFEVEKPSRMSTEVLVKEGDRVAVLKVNQRVTALRGGLEGEAFRDTFSAKNTVQLPGARTRATTPETGAKPQDPLLDLIKKKER